MKRYVVEAILLIAIIGGGVLAAVVGDEQASKQHEFMRLKLNHSQKILEGLVVEDYDIMAKNAQQLSLLSLDASWQVFETMEYSQQSLEFRRAADSLTAAAKKKNLDGAALAYVEVTMKCVNCHKYVRDTRRAVANK